ncbi:MAG: WD40 repeat domain-containing protein, partial [Anaerolineae bacterium]|nr:WD40 repeat domain-containing protein [Anaerolineae bacterium]
MTGRDYKAIKSSKRISSNLSGGFAIFTGLLVVGTVSCSQSRELTETPTSTEAPTQTSTPVPFTPTIEFLPTEVFRGETPLPPTPMPIVILPDTDRGIGDEIPNTNQQIAKNNVDQISLLAEWGQGTLTTLRYSNDESLLAVGTTIGVKVFDASNPEDILLSIDTKYAAGTIAWGKNNRLLAVASNVPPYIEVWDIITLEKVFEEDYRAEDKFGYNISKIAFSTDNNFFAASVVRSWNDLVIFMWDVDNWDRIRREKDVKNFSLSPDGETILLITREQIVLRNSSTWEVIFSVPFDYGTSATFSENGNRIAIGSIRGFIQIIDSNNGGLIHEINPLKPVRTPLITYTCDETVEHQPHESPMPPSVWDIQLASDGNKFAAIYDFDGETITLIREYSFSNGSAGKEYSGDSFGDFDFSPTRKRLAISMPHNGAVHIWNIDTQLLDKSIQLFYDMPYSLQVSGQGEWLAIEYRESTIIRRLNDGGLLRSIQGVVALSPRDDTIALGYIEGHLVIQDVNGEEESLIAQGLGRIIDLEYSPDGQVLYLSTAQCINQARAVSTGALLHSFDSPTDAGLYVETTRLQINDILISPDGDFLFGRDYFGKINIWDIQNNASKRLSAEVYCGAHGFDSNGRVLVTADIGHILIYDFHKETFRDGIKIVSDKEWEWTVEALAFSPSGKILAVGLDD